MLQDIDTFLAATMNLPCHPLSHGLVQGDIWGREQTKLGTWKIEIPQMKG
jgi:hypothetical protein